MWGGVDSFPVHLWDNLAQDTWGTVVPVVLRWDYPWSDADRLSACQKMRINRRSCRLIAAIETDEAARSQAPTQHISSCNFTESVRLPPPPGAGDRYRRLKRLKFVSAIWVSHFLNHRDQFVISRGDQHKCTHINTYENLCMDMVLPPCFKISCQPPLDPNCCYTLSLYHRHKYIFIISRTSFLPADKFKDT